MATIHGMPHAAPQHTAGWRCTAMSASASACDGENYKRVQGYHVHHISASPSTRAERHPEHHRSQHATTTMCTLCHHFLCAARTHPTQDTDGPGCCFLYLCLAVKSVNVVAWVQASSSMKQLIRVGFHVQFSCAGEEALPPFQQARVRAMSATGILSFGKTACMRSCWCRMRMALLCVLACATAVSFAIPAAAGRHGQTVALLTARSMRRCYADVGGASFLQIADHAAASRTLSHNLGSGRARRRCGAARQY